MTDITTETIQEEFDVQMVLDSAHTIDRILKNLILKEPFSSRSEILQTNISYVEREMQKPEYQQLLTQEQTEYLTDLISTAKASL